MSCRELKTLVVQTKKIKAMKNSFKNSNVVITPGTGTPIGTGKHIDKTFTSTNGCVFHIVGEYDIWSGTFVGTITISGKGCPSGTWNFTS